MFCSTARMPLSVHTICPTGSLSSTQNESTHYNRGRENELHYSIGDGEVSPNIHTGLLTTGPERWSIVCQSPEPRPPGFPSSLALREPGCASSSQACLPRLLGLCRGIWDAPSMPHTDRANLDLWHLSSYSHPILLEERPWCSLRGPGSLLCPERCRPHQCSRTLAKQRPELVQGEVCVMRQMAYSWWPIQLTRL